LIGITQNREETKNKEAAKEAYAGQLKPEKKTTLLSGKDSIYPELEIGDSGAVFVYGGPIGSPIFKLAEDNEIKIELLNGQIQISTKILDIKGKIIAEIIDNEWRVNPHNAWDRNYTKNALEVRDPCGDIVFQAILVGNRVQLQLMLYTYEGKMFGLVSEGPGKGGLIVLNQKYKIKPIFKYPSDLHFGEFVNN